MPKGRQEGEKDTGPLPPPPPPLPPPLLLPPGEEAVPLLPPPPPLRCRVRFLLQPLSLISEPVSAAQKREGILLKATEGITNRAPVLEIQGEHHVKMKAEIGDASTSQGAPKMASRPPEARQMPGIDSSSHPSEGINFVDTLILDSSLQNCETINFGCVSHQVCGALL
ncbi:uncharacterized protein LOC118540087 [Halichoerus grypus]